MNPHELSVGLSEADQQRILDVHRIADAGESAVPALIGMLAERSWTVRREVVAALASIGQPSAAPLCEVLRSGRGDENRIAAAVDALVSIHADVLPLIEYLAEDSNPAVVADAAQIAGRRRASKAVPLLTRLVGHPDDNVAIAAIESLGRVGGRAAVDTLMSAARSNSFFRVFPSIDVLGRSGDPRAIAPLTELLSNPTYALEAARALGRTGEAAALPALAALLTSSSDSIVRVAAVAIRDLFGNHLSRFGSDAALGPALLRSVSPEPAVRHLAHALSNADEGEQVAIAFVLGILGGDGAIAALRPLLDVQPHVASAAAAALKQMGRRSDRQLREALRDGNSARRLVVIPIVTRASLAPELVLCLRDPDPRVRAAACDAIARVGATDAVEPLFTLLADENPRTVQAAIGAIQSLGTVQAGELAIRATSDPKPGVRRSALRILAYFGLDSAVPAFLAALEDPDPRVQEAAISGLPFLNEASALDALLAAARNPSDRLRSTAMRSLGQTPRKDPRIAAYLLAGLSDPAPWVRYFACQSLGRLGDTRAAERIAHLLETDAAGQVRVAAVEALALIQGDMALRALSAAADGDEPDVARAALIGLGMSRRPEALAILRRAARSPDPATRLVAISAIADGTSPHAIPELERASRDQDPNVRAAAIGFLAAAPVPEATSVLIDLMIDGTERERVIEALTVPAEGRVSSIVSALDSADDQLAPTLASALVRLRTPEAISALLNVLSSSAVPARKASASALAALATREAMGAIGRAAEGDPDSQVRQVCAALLAK